jgi:homoserine O-acetyltransferase
MNRFKFLNSWCLVLLLGLTSLAAQAQTQTQTASYPTPIEGDFVLENFKFHTGEVLPAVKIHYTTVGNPAGMPVLILHGTTGSGTGMLGAGFAGELFGKGQALDASQYFIILPDALGAGASSKPSDGLKAKFPNYNYADMVSAQHRLVTEKFKLKHLRLVLGNSMGGMQTWNWGTTYPDFMDALVPMAATPMPMSGRNWMMRRLIIDSIRNDPTWQGGNYIQQPASLQFASVFFGIGTSGGNQALQRLAPTAERADALLDGRLKAASKADANDNLYQWESSRDFDPVSVLNRIKAPLLAINSADDERNPPELGVMETTLARIPGAKLFLIPASSQTAGHGTTMQAKWWQDELKKLLASAPVLAPSN